MRITTSPSNSNTTTTERTSLLSSGILGRARSVVGLPINTTTTILTKKKCKADDKVATTATEAPRPTLDAKSHAEPPSTSSSTESPSKFPILLELIGIRHLPVRNMESYAVFQYGTQIVGRTQPYIPKVTRTERVSRMLQVFGGGSVQQNRNSWSTNLQRNLQNPIWTLQEDSVVVVQVSLQDLANHKPLTIQLWARQRPISLGGRALGVVASTLWKSTSAGISNPAMAAEAALIEHLEDDEEDEYEYGEGHPWGYVEDEMLYHQRHHRASMPAAVTAKSAETTSFTQSVRTPTNSPDTKRAQPQPPQDQTKTPPAKTQFIGKVRIPVTKLMDEYCTEQRIEVPLVDELGRPVKQPDTQFTTMLSLRCRFASTADVQFAQAWSKLTNKNKNTFLAVRLAASIQRQKPSPLLTMLQQAQIFQEPHRIRAALITEQPEYEVSGGSLSSAIWTTTSVVRNNISSTNRGKVQVKPYADPYTAETRQKTLYMTPTLLKTLTKAPSRNWIQVGSMKPITPKAKCSTSNQQQQQERQTSVHGRLYLEILSAHNLPNVDIGETLGNQTDAFCSIVYGDCFVETDVIPDELSPHWLPWTKRAFCFALGHPCQVLYLAVFGFKKHPLQHVPIGRVEVNTTNLQHDTLYELHYDLKARSHFYRYGSNNSSTSNNSNNHPNNATSSGRLRVRVRIEADDERKYLLASLTLPPLQYINVTSKKSMRVARYTCMGEYDSPDKFQLSVLQGYVDEILQGYVPRILYSLHDGLKSLMLWRNQVEIRYIGPFPLYSLLAFGMLLLAVELPTLIPGMMCWGLALFLLVQVQQRNCQNPSPLKRSFGFGYYLQILMTGKLTKEFQDIKPNVGLKEMEALEKMLEERVEKDREFFDKKEAVEKVIEEIEQERVATRIRTVPIEVMTMLGKVQGIVGTVVRAFRLVDTVITWEQSDLSFFLTLSLLMIGVIMMFIPWGFLFTWTGRIAVVVLLGPQNKILDLVYFRRNKTDGQKIRQLFLERMLEARVKQEDNRKLKAFRHALFGKYSTSVPSIMWTPHNDFPKPSSSARYHGSDSCVFPRARDLERCLFVPGQKLHGWIIPRPEEYWQTNQEESQRAKKTYQKLRENTKSGDKNTAATRLDLLEGNDMASIASQEGFEVMELYDEELGFVKNVLDPPREDSAMVLGVEIFQNSAGEDLQFEEAFRSVHDSSAEEDVVEGAQTYSTDSDADEIEEKKKNELFPSSAQITTSAKEPLGESKTGIEITEVLEREAQFVRRSWRGMSSSSLMARLPSLRFSSKSLSMLSSSQDLGITPETSMDDTQNTAKLLETENKNKRLKATPIATISESLSSKERIIEAMLSEDSMDLAASSSPSGMEGFGGDDHVLEDSEERRLLEQYHQPRPMESSSFSSVLNASLFSKTSVAAGHYHRTNTKDESSQSMGRDPYNSAIDDGWIATDHANSFSWRESSFDEDEDIEGGAVSVKGEVDGDVDDTNEKEHHATTIHLSSTADLGDLGFEIFET